MPRLLPALLAFALAAGAAAAAAQQDRNAERAQRRQQLQMQELRQQLQGAQRQLEETRAARDKADTERRDLAERQRRDAGMLARAQSERARLDGELKSSSAERAALTARVAELERQLAEHKRLGDEAQQGAARERAEALRQSARRDAEQAQLQERFAEQIKLVTQCTEKNQRLAALSLELVERWRDKTAFDAVRQREPLLGLRDVEVFNLVQEYRDRSDAERFRPGTSR